MSEEYSALIDIAKVDASYIGKIPKVKKEHPRQKIGRT